MTFRSVADFEAILERRRQYLADNGYVQNLYVSVDGATYVDFTKIAETKAFFPYDKLTIRNRGQSGAVSVVLNNPADILDVDGQIPDYYLETGTFVEIYGERVYGLGLKANVTTIVDITVSRDVKE